MVLCSTAIGAVVDHLKKTLAMPAETLIYRNPTHVYFMILDLVREVVLANPPKGIIILGCSDDEQTTLQAQVASEAVKLDLWRLLGVPRLFSGVQATPLSYVPISIVLHALCLCTRAGGCRWRHPLPRKRDQVLHGH